MLERGQGERIVWYLCGLVGSSQGAIPLTESLWTEVNERGIGQRRTKSNQF
jgi:hypothetical protein